MRTRARWIAAAAALALTIGAASIGAKSAAKSAPPSFEIRKPTIIAFFPPVTDKDLDDDTADALDDFQYYADEVRGPLKRAGVEFQEAYARTFTVRLGAKTIVFRVGKEEVGYYFVAPGKKPHVEYGVMDDDDILSEAHEYFGVAIPDADAGHQALLIKPASNSAAR